MVARLIRSGIFGLPQSRPLANVQSKVRISPTAPAARARSTRASISARPPIQYTWKNVWGVGAATCSTGFVPDPLTPPPRAAPANPVHLEERLGVGRSHLLDRLAAERAQPHHGAAVRRRAGDR